MTEKTPKKTQLVGASYLTTRILNRATNILISVPCELSLRHFFPQVVWVVTFVAVLLLGVDLGLAVGVLGLLVTVVLRVYKPQVTVRGALGNTDIYRDIEKFEKVRFFSAFAANVCVAQITLSRFTASANGERRRYLSQLRSPVRSGSLATKRRVYLLRAQSFRYIWHVLRLGCK